MRLRRKNRPCNDRQAVQLAIRVVILVRNVLSLVSVLRVHSSTPRQSSTSFFLVRKQDGHNLCAAVRG